jgi:hypothetical protein
MYVYSGNNGLHVRIFRECWPVCTYIHTNIGELLPDVRWPAQVLEPAHMYTNVGLNVRILCACQHES